MHDPFADLAPDGALAVPPPIDEEGDSPTTQERKRRVTGTGLISNLCRWWVEGRLTAADFCTEPDTATHRPWQWPP